jgi:16S rRNA (guanine966-N2)-methyltransferase|tara:strand:- start:362 stop:958 length:597 start_codon:yes stop_codon:yes gene_type:complete
MKKQKNKALNLKVKIISGIWGGRNINFLSKKDLRPTKNIIRETLFNWLGSDLTDLICLDLFAGSGVLGFESASRGAKNVYLVDIDRDVVRCLEEQKNILDAKNILIEHSSSDDFISKFTGKVDLLFLDPPFSDIIINTTINSSGFSQLLNNNCKIYIEIPFEQNYVDIIKAPISWKLIKHGKSGDVAYLLYKHNYSMI